MNYSLDFKLADESMGELRIDKVNDYSWELRYPCDDSSYCTPYKATFPAGTYYVELYGASGGSHYPSSAFRYWNNTIQDKETVKLYKGNALSNPIPSNAGSGGYTAGVLTIPKPSLIMITLGGMGSNKIGDFNDTKGGYNGGGSPAHHANAVYGGGGATDLRAEVDDVFHRIMVSGGGGGADNGGGIFAGGDDGSGGAGGGLVAQGFFINGIYYNHCIADQISGFSFGQGEAAYDTGSKHPKGNKLISGGFDRSGAGGGWFGGFASHNSQGGGGGGSSFALTRKAVFPKGLIDTFDQYYHKTGEGYYAFRHNDYQVTNPVFIPGIWSGNGLARISVMSHLSSIQQIVQITNNCNNFKLHQFPLFIFICFSQ